VKTLILAGNPESQYGKEHRRDLARIWVENGHVLVRELGEPYKEFAHEVQQQLNERLGNPKAPIHCMTGATRIKKDGTVINTDAIRISSPEKEDFLEVLRGDMFLWQIGHPIAGYEVYTGASYILED